MKPKTIILMIVAIACGLGASYGTTQLIADKKEPEAAKKVPVLFAKKNVPKWKRIQTPKDYFEVRQMSESDAPKSRIGDFSEVKNWRLRNDLTKDQYLQPENILDGPIDPLSLPKGFGASAIPITAVSSAGFFVQAGDHVDVYWTSRRSGTRAKTVSKVLLDGVLVVAAGPQTTKTRTPEEHTVQASTMTFALKSNEKKLLDVAEKEGFLSLFRLHNDAEVNEDREDLDDDQLKTLVDELNGIEKREVAGPIVKVGPDIKTKVKEPDPEMVAILPVHVQVYRRGNNPPERIYWYEDGHGSLHAERVPVKYVPKNPPKEGKKDDGASEDGKPEASEGGSNADPGKAPEKTAEPRNDDG